MKSEEITKTIAALKPSIESITDNNIKTIFNTLISIIDSQQKTISEQQEVIEAQQKAIEEQGEIIIEKNKTIEIQLKEIEDLKEKLNTNSNNSSKPPSSEIGKTKKKKNNNSNGSQKRNRGGQTGHKGVTRQLLPEDEVDHIEKHQPPKQCSCGGHVQINEDYQRHQVHEIPPIKTVVTEHQLFFGCCEGCGKKHSAQLPSNVPTGMLGPCLLALIATLTSDYKMSKRDVTRILEDLYSLSICVATVKRAEGTVSEAIKTPVEEANTYVKEQAVVNCDETSHAECGKKMWTWVAIANSVAVFMIAASRSAKVAKELLGEGFKGILGSDRYSAYAWVDAAFRQVCWAHLKRDFKKISERTGKSKWIGLRLLVYTKRMFHYWHQVRDGTITRQRFKHLMKPIREKIESLLLAGTEADNDKTKGTCREMLKVKTAFWTFIETNGELFDKKFAYHPEMKKAHEKNK